MLHDICRVIPLLLLLSVPLTMRGEGEVIYENIVYSWYSPGTGYAQTTTSTSLATAKIRSYVTCSNGDRVKVGWIGPQAFAKCPYLKSITMPAHITAF